MNILNYIENYTSDETKLRNPVLEIDGFKIGIIGDVHIGKSFRTGVPKDRLGERESIVLNQLTDLLNRPVDFTVLVGDLFDKIRVSNNDLYQLINIVERACKANTSVQYVILNGNHDMPKEVNRISSFQLFEKYFELSPLDNLLIISDGNLEKDIVIKNNTLLYFSHYNPFIGLDEEVGQELSDIDYTKYKNKIAFGHWETTDFGSDVFIDRDIPKCVLDNFDLVITGHEHKPKLSKIKNVFKSVIPIYTVGSMQPYAFGEELSHETLYISLKVDKFNKLYSKDNNYFINSNVRLLLSEDDEIPDSFNCLSRTFKNLINKVEQNAEIEIDSSNTSPISFQKSFLDLIDTMKKDNDNLVPLLDGIVRTFLDKSYKENN